MENSKRLTAKRCNGIKDGYWSMAHKEELAQRLGRFEDIIDTPEELIDTLKAYDNTVEMLVLAIRNAVNAPEDEDNMEKLRALVSAYDKILLSRAKAPTQPSEPSSAI